MSFDTDDTRRWEDLMAAFGRPEANHTHTTHIDNYMIAPHFRRAIGRLGHLLPVSKASLAILEPQGRHLQVAHIYDKGLFHGNVVVLIPTANSLLYQTLLQGFPVVDNYPELATSNIIEKKILLSSGAKAVLIAPLVHEGHRLGILSLTSRQSYAFGSYLEGIGQGVVADLAESLGECLRQDAIRV
jgi:hypothetical protein